MSVSSLLRGRVYLAVLALGVALLLAAACNGDDGGGTTPTGGETPATGGETPATGGETPAAGGETPAAGGATAEIKMIPTIQFDKSELTIAADTDVSVAVDNEDAGISHNFSVYRDDSASENLGKTDIRSGLDMQTLTLNLPAGEYFFRCDVHTAVMTGTLIVE